MIEIVVALVYLASFLSLIIWVLMEWALSACALIRRATRVHGGGWVTLLTGSDVSMSALAKRERNLREVIRELDVTDPVVLETLEQAAKARLPGYVAHFHCAICFDVHAMEECFIVSMCGHKFCREGARGLALSAIRCHVSAEGCAGLRSGELPVLCPVCKAGPQPACSSCEAKRAASNRMEAAGGPKPGGAASDWCCTMDGDLPLLLTLEEEEQYNSCSVRVASSKTKDLVPCPEPDCCGLAVAGGADMSPRLVCNKCGHIWCGSCLVKWHTNQSCEKYLRKHGESVAETSLKEFRENNRLMTCPNCGMGITKISGCDRVRCSCCSTDMCFQCGNFAGRCKGYPSCG